MDNTITLTFNDFSLIHERKPFPNIYVTIDAMNLEVWFKVFVLETQINVEGYTLDKVKEWLTNISDVDRWEQERDIPHRRYELYGIIYLDKKLRLTNRASRYIISVSN